MNRRKVWAVAFAKQAEADLNTYYFLDQEAIIPRCQPLHFLQMACEKLCKAQLCHTGANPEDLAKSHAYAREHLLKLFRRSFTEQKRSVPKADSTFMKQIGHVAREIDLLSPAIRDGERRLGNTEYPWGVRDASGGESVFIPSEHEFATLDLLNQPAGRKMLKLLRISIDDLAGERTETKKMGSS